MGNYDISDDIMDLCLESSKEGGEISMRKKNIAEKKKKSDDTFVTEADIEVEKHIREKLDKKSNYPILGEEDGGKVENFDTYWVVDPIDGTQNYAYQQPLYGTGVALVKDNNPFAGCFYMPELDYMFYAKKGEGAFMNETPLSVSSRTEVDNAYLSLTGHHMPPNTSELCSDLNRWYQSFSCALQSECWTSKGWADACICGKLFPWDLGPGVVIMREAGGVAKNLKNSKTDWCNLSNGGVVMGNEEIVDKIIEKLSEDTIENLGPW